MISCPLAARYRLLIGHRDCMREGWRSCKRYRLRIMMSVNYSTVAWHTGCRSSSVGKIRFSGWVHSLIILIARLKLQTMPNDMWPVKVTICRVCDKYSWFIRLMPVTAWVQEDKWHAYFCKMINLDHAVFYFCVHLGLVTWWDKSSSLYGKYIDVENAVRLSTVLHVRSFRMKLNGNAFRYKVYQHNLRESCTCVSLWTDRKMLGYGRKTSSRPERLEKSEQINDKSIHSG